MQWVERILFIVGVLVFLSIQLTMVVVPILNRSVPVEADDAYTYILKAAEMQDCFLQDCPALNDLRQQLTASSENQDIVWLRYREYVRAFSVYHPLHSLILVGLHATGLSWEASFELVELAGSLLLSFTISYWLYRLFGSGSAGLALLLLAFTPLPNQGLHYIVPSNMALGIALFLWGYLLEKQNKSPWIIISGTLALVVMHPIGRLYAALGIVLFVFLNFRQLKREDWLASGLGILLVGIAFLLPLLVTRPEFSFPADPPPADWTPRMGYINNFTRAGAFVTGWMRFYENIAVAILFLSVGLFSLRHSDKVWRVGSMGILLGGLLLASLFQVLPRYPAEAFSRVWIPSVIFLTGIIAHGLWRWFVALMDQIRQLSQTGLPVFRDARQGISRPVWTIALLLVVGAIAMRITLHSLVVGQRGFREELNFLIEVQNSRLEPEQPSLLHDKGCRDILYMFEVPMHHYFAHGALACGAIYHPSLNGTPEETRWIEENSNLGYIVTWNPTIESSVVGGGNPLALEKNDRLDVYIPEVWPSPSVYIYLENRRGETDLDLFSLATEDGKKSKKLGSISIPAGWSGWQKIDVTVQELAHGFSLHTDKTSPMLVLRGIKSDLESAQNWPWDRGVKLIHQLSKQKKVEINFSTAGLIPYSNWSLTVLDDRGDTVLLKVNR